MCLAANEVRRSEIRAELLFDLFRGRHRPVAGNDLPAPIDEELGEVPCDVFLALFICLRRFEELVEITSAVAVDLDLREQREIDVVLGLGELENLGVTAGLLSAELIAGET